MIVALVLIVPALPVFADYEISWHTIDGGGGVSSGGDCVLTGTIGQPDSGIMSAGDYVLNGGFWAGSYAGHVVLC